MIDLAKYIQQTHREKKQKESIRIHQHPSERPLAQIPAEIQILQSGQQNNALTSSVFINNLGDSKEDVNSGEKVIIQHDNDQQADVQQANDQQFNIVANEGKISLTALLLCFFLYISAITLVVYGAVHFKDCPAADMIAISYVVMGCLMLVSRILSSPEECRNIFKKERNSAFIPQTLCRMCLNFIFQIATLVFFFNVCYWVFTIHPDNTELDNSSDNCTTEEPDIFDTTEEPDIFDTTEEPDIFDTTVGPPNYCEKEFYKNAKYGCIGALSLLGFICVLVSFKLCSHMCRSRQK